MNSFCTCMYVIHSFFSVAVGKLMNNMMRSIKFLFFGTVRKRLSESVMN